MAIRRATQKAQVIARLSASAPAGETFIACVHGETGPGLWLTTLIGQVPFGDLIVGLTRRRYFFTLTNSEVIVNSASRFTNRPGPIVATFPRSEFPASRYHRGAVWSKFYVKLRSTSKPARINVHRLWRAELDQLAAAFPVEGGVVAGSGQAGTAQSLS